MLAVIRLFGWLILAVFLADSWLLFDNSQLLRKPLPKLTKFTLNFQHNSQQKNVLP